MLAFPVMSWAVWILLANFQMTGSWKWRPWHESQWHIDYSSVSTPGRQNHLLIRSSFGCLATGDMIQWNKIIPHGFLGVLAKDFFFFSYDLSASSSLLVKTVTYPWRGNHHIIRCGWQAVMFLYVGEWISQALAQAPLPVKGDWRLRD